LAREFSTKLEGDRRAQMAYGGISNTTTFKFASKDYLLNRYPGIRPPRSLLLSLLFRRLVRLLLLQDLGEYWIWTTYSSFVRFERV